MTTKRDPWVEVKSEDELRAGMSVSLRPCAKGHRHAFVLLRRASRVAKCRAHGESICGWEIAGGYCRDPLTVPILCPTTCVREGRLFRLADDQLTDLSETRELESVR